MDLIIHDISAWSNIAFNTNLMIISSNVEFNKYRPVSFLQLIHLIYMQSSFYLSPIKSNPNIANAFNNEGIISLFGFIILAVCSIMTRKGNHWILYFIDVGQYKSLSWRLISFFSECLYRLESIYFSYSVASWFSFHYWSNDGWLIYFNRG